MTDRHFVSRSKAFENKSSTNIKFSKIQLSKIIQSGGFLGRLPGPLQKVGFPLIKNVLQSLAKYVDTIMINNSSLIKHLGVWNNNTSNTNKKMKNMKIIKFRENSGQLLERFTIENKTKAQRSESLSIVLST